MKKGTKVPLLIKKIHLLFYKHSTLIWLTKSPKSDSTCNRALQITLTFSLLLKMESTLHLPKISLSTGNLFKAINLLLLKTLSIPRYLLLLLTLTLKSNSLKTLSLTLKETLLKLKLLVYRSRCNFYLNKKHLEVKFKNLKKKRKKN